MAENANEKEATAFCSFQRFGSLTSYKASGDHFSTGLIELGFNGTFSTLRL